MQDNAPAPALAAAASLGSSSTLDAILAIKIGFYCQYTQLQRDRKIILDLDSPRTLEILKLSSSQTRTKHGFNWVVVNMKYNEWMKLVEVTSFTHLAVHGPRLLPMPSSFLLRSMGTKR